MQRRSFLRSAATAAASLPLSAFASRAVANPRPNGTGYGPLITALDETTGLPLLELPAGFRYKSLGWTGDVMLNGQPTPAAHDGMVALHWHGHRVRLVRNHETGLGTPFTNVAYDSGASGGTTTIEFDQKSGEYLGTIPSLSGTVRNCAGGPTLWGSWLTCEETTLFNAATGRPHGYVFDVPADGAGDPEPIRDMGRFSHEAVAADPVTGFIYETEDAGGSSGFYRFVPHNRNRLGDGGRLFMLKVATENLANLG
jgi:secreted PhoX family phosphatase